MINFRHMFSTNKIHPDSTNPRLEKYRLKKIHYYIPVYTHLTKDFADIRGKAMGTDGKPRTDLPPLSLAEWLELTETSYSAFSRMIGVSIGYPRMLALGLARPSYEKACRIEEVTEGQVPRTNWYPSGKEVEPETTSIEGLDL